MLKKTIEYDGFDGTKYKEDFWFHLTEADIAEMELGATREGGFEALVRKIVSTTDGKKLVELFKDVIMLSIGEKTADNKHFRKTDEIRENFRSSNAYSKLFIELVTETQAGIDFINGIVPASLREKRALNEATEKVANRPEIVDTPSTPTPEASVTTDIRPEPVPEEKDDRPDWLKEGRVPTSDELKGATPEQIQAAFRIREANATA